MPDRIISLWLSAAASAGGSFNVGISISEIFIFSIYYGIIQNQEKKLGSVLAFCVSRKARNAKRKDRPHYFLDNILQLIIIIKEKIKEHQMKNKINIYAFLLLIIIFALPSLAHAYVDPGIIGAFFQVIFVVIFGSVLAFVTKPWRFIKSLFIKNKPKKTEKKEKKETK